MTYIYRKSRKNPAFKMESGRCGVNLNVLCGVNDAGLCANCAGIHQPFPCDDANKILGVM